MKNLRQIHLYLGVVFAPMIIYFSISGAWQIFRFNDVPKEGPPSAIRSFFRELSKPHTHSTLPGLDSRVGSSMAFNWLALLMALGLIGTTLIGLTLAFRSSKSSRVALLCLSVGILLPIILLLLR